MSCYVTCEVCDQSYDNGDPHACDGPSVESYVDLERRICALEDENAELTKRVEVLEKVLVSDGK